MTMPRLASSRWWYIMPIVFVTYSLAYLDRANYGFAAASGMADDLRITPGLSSLLGALFFLGYFFFQVPGAIYAEKRSVKKLIFVSLILWGGLATLTGMVANVYLLIGIRFLLGVVEAAVMPAMLVYLCVPGAFMGANLVAMLYLQGPLGLSASRAGALMLPWALAAGLAIGLTRRRFNRWGPKSLLLAGMAIQAGGLLWLARSGEGSGFWQLAGAYATMGFGGSLCSSAAQGMALLDVPAARMGHASALWNINRQLAFCLGMAVLGGLLNLLQARADPAAFVHCFLFAAAFTLLPLPWVRRIDSAGVRALVQT